MKIDRDELRVWLLYVAAMAALTWVAFGGLRLHQLDTHDAESFADHLRIEQDGSYFFSPDKEQATGRLFADAVKYATFLVFGNDAAAFHLLVVAVHMLAALLLALLLRRMGLAIEWALCAGLLFLLNVAHFQAIHHISALDYPLGMVCICAALICLESTSRWKWGYFSALMVLAIQSHPSLAALWLLPLYRLWRAGLGRRLFYNFVATALPMALAVIASVLLASRNTSTWHAVDEYAASSPTVIAVGQLRVLLLFCSRLLSTAHWLPLPIHSQALWELGLGLGVVASLIYLVYRRQEPLDWAALWVLAGLFPYMLLTAATIDGLPAGPSRYLYIASAGSSILLAAAWQYIYCRQRYFGGALLLAIVVSSCVNLRKVEAISHYTSARSYSARLEIDTALDQYEQALEKAPDVLPLEDVYTRYIIMLMGSERDFHSPLAAALRRFPDSPRLQIYQLAARATVEEEDVRVQAMKDLKQKIYTLNYARNLSSRALYNIGSGFLKRGDESNAIRAFEQGVVVDPQRAKTLRILGLSYLQQAAKRAQVASPEELASYQQKAIIVYKKGIEVDPDPDLFYALGRIYEVSGYLDSAQAAYQACVERKPHHAPSLQHIAQIYQAQGLYPQAIAYWENAIEVAPNSDAYFFLGNLYLQNGNTTGAVQAYTEANRLEPNSIEVLANWGNALKQLGQFSEAALTYRRAIELAPENPYLYYMLGEVENMQGNAEQAIASFAQSIENGIDYDEAYTVIVDLLRARGRELEAKKWEKKRAVAQSVERPLLSQPLIK